MKVKIGSFDERIATELAKALKSIGIGVEVRKLIDLDFYPFYFVEGRFSELRNKYEETELIDEIKRWKGYLDLAKDVKCLEELEKKILDIFDSEIDAYSTLGILYDMLELNEMVDGDKVKDPPEDPIIRFPYKTDEDKAKKLDLKQKLIVLANTICEVFAELGDAIFNDKLANLCENYDDLISLIMTAGIAENILEKVAEGKVNVEEILRMNRIEIGDKIEIKVSGEVLKSILEELEKTGYVKIKRGRIFLRV